MEGKKDSGILAQMKRTVEAIWAGKHGGFFTWLYLLGSLALFITTQSVGTRIALNVEIFLSGCLVSIHCMEKIGIKSRQFSSFFILDLVNS